MNSKKTTKTFKEYYQDPVFRARHKKYLLTKIECPECGCVTSRCNMSHHKKTEKHKRLFRWGQILFIINVIINDLIK